LRGHPLPPARTPPPPPRSLKRHFHFTYTHTPPSFHSRGRSSPHTHTHTHAHTHIHTSSLKISLTNMHAPLPPAFSPTAESDERQVPGDGDREDGAEARGGRPGGAADGQDVQERAETRRRGAPRTGWNPRHGEVRRGEKKNQRNLAPPTKNQKPSPFSTLVPTLVPNPQH
jgi:hypothetical protein